MEEILEAVPVPGELAVAGGIAVNWGGLEARLAKINDAVGAARDMSQQLEIGDEALSRLDRKEAKRLEQALSAAINDAEKARKEFNADYDTPKKRVAVAYQEAMDAAVSLHARYKARRLEAEGAEKAEKMAALEDVYLRFMEDNGFSELAAAIPFESIADKRWSNLAANPKTCAWEVEQIASGLMADWRRLSEQAVAYPDRAKAEFIRTHDLGAALDASRRTEEEAEQVRRVEAEREEVAAFTAQEPQAEPEIVREAEEVIASAETVWRYTLTADMTEGQFEALVGWLKASGIHGSFRKEARNG